MHSFFDPASPQGRAVAQLWWWMVGVGGVIWLGVAALAIAGAVAARGRRRADDTMGVAPSTPRGLERAVAGATFATVLVLFGFLVYDFAVGRALAEHPRRALTIELTGHQWWWEATYLDPDPSKRITTANELHVPVGEPVQIRLRAADVIHSVWAPSLNGKRDLIPGYVSSWWFTADTAGVYRGQCAEYCGLQHAQMAFYVIAEPRLQFAAWLAAAAASPPPPTDSTLLAGRSVFMSSGCATCHGIAGTPARATVGPDLTHLKSRLSIAAGTLANTRANLTRWVADPAAVKPGVRMPTLPLAPNELHALVAYLETLK